MIRQSSDGLKSLDRLLKLLYQAGFILIFPQRHILPALDKFVIVGTIERVEFQLPIIAI